MNILLFVWDPIRGGEFSLSSLLSAVGPRGFRHMVFRTLLSSFQAWSLSDLSICAIHYYMLQVHCVMIADVTSAISSLESGYEGVRIEYWYFSPSED